METSEILELKGSDLGYSEWFLIDQQRVNDFADATIDHQFIHVDEAAATAGPFGGTIVHGFLTLSLLVHLASELAPPLDSLVMGINYGFEKIRFLAPVPVGSEIRAHMTVADVIERSPGQFLFTQDVTVEIRGKDKPALVAQWLSLQITA
ncbi:MaoC family dehydratase [Actinomycetota bacterium]